MQPPRPALRPHVLLALRVVFILVVLVSAGCGAPAESGAPTASAAVLPPLSVAPSLAAAPPCPAPAPPDVTAVSWWRDRVFYETFVRSFAASDGDGIGDLPGLTSHLDYLNDGDPTTTDDLGVTALWLMPIDASPSYHGYDVTDYRAVEPDYGTNDDFRALVAAAHDRGIEIIVDLVLNHTSVDHPWFRDARIPGSEHRDWYRWADAHPGFSGPGGRPVWHQDGDQWYYGYFWEGMPDLDLTNPDVTSELDSIARFWVDEMGAAGFRLDAARHLIEDGSTMENTPATFDWLRGFRGRLQAAAPDALVLGEVWDPTIVASRYVRDGALDLTFDFELAQQMLQAVRSGDAGSLRIIQTGVTDAYPPGGYASFLTNHDQDRAFDTVGGEVARAKQAATLLLTSPGVPFLYYGEEVGLTGRKPDERIRTPMPWTAEAPGFGFTTGEPWEPMADDTATTNVATQTGDPASLLSWYRSLIALRAAYPALRPSGTLTGLDASSRAIYANLRHDPATSGAVVVVSNLSDEAIDGATLTLADGPLCGAPTAETVLATAPTEVTAPPINEAGGFDAWAVGSLPANGDLVIALTP